MQIASRILTEKESGKCSFSFPRQRPEWVVMELLCSPEDISAHLAPKYPHPPPPSPAFVTFYCVTFSMALIIPGVLYMCHDVFMATLPH